MPRHNNNTNNSGGQSSTRTTTAVDLIGNLETKSLVTLSLQQATNDHSDDIHYMLLDLLRQGATRSNHTQLNQASFMHMLHIFLVLCESITTPHTGLHYFQWTQIFPEMTVFKGHFFENDKEKHAVLFGQRPENIEAES